MRRASSWLLIGSAITALGCGGRVAYTPPAPAPPEESLTVHAPFERAWAAVVQIFFQRNIPIKTIEKASGILESDELHGEVGGDCHCGTYLGVPVGGYGGAYGGDAYYRYRVLVEPRGEATSITVRSSCRGRTGGIEGELACVLNPEKRSELVQAIQRIATSSAD